VNERKEQISEKLRRVRRNEVMIDCSLVLLGVGMRDKM
jgi:hypothetical protein